MRRGGTPISRAILFTLHLVCKDYGYIQAFQTMRASGKPLRAARGRGLSLLLALDSNSRELFDLELLARLLGKP